ncbi:MAG: AzlD domain-containing protein [Ruminococcaceae bacterium]|nr:AzlD domain-containing protein [Oscillospiraceae bacterium]
MPFDKFLPYLIVMSGVTYLVRAIPLTLFRKRIKNRFINSFLYYTPYAVLAAMTFPAILYATSSIATAIVGLIAALILAFFGQGLLTVACGACLSVFITELIMRLI